MTTMINLNPGAMEHVHQGRAKLMFVTGSGTPAERETEVGIVTVAEAEMSAETTKIYSSNFPTRRQVGSLDNETGMTFNFTTQSITRDVRIMSLLGLEAPYSLAENATFLKEFGDAKAGDRLPLGRPVTNVEIEGLEGGIDFIYEAETRTVIMKVDAAEVVVGGNAPAVIGALQAAVGARSNREVHLRIYGIEQDKAPYQLEVVKGTIRPSSPLGLIGENDPIEAEFSVECAVDATGSFGTLILY